MRNTRSQSWGPNGRDPRSRFTGSGNGQGRYSDDNRRGSQGGYSHAGYDDEDYDNRYDTRSYNEDWEEDEEYDVRAGFGEDYDDEEYDVQGGYDNDEEWEGYENRGEGPRGIRRSTGRGFSSMPRERRTTSMDNRTSYSGGRGRDYEADRYSGRSSNRSGYSTGRNDTSSRGLSKRNSPERGISSSRSNSVRSDSRNGGRGFGSMPRDEVRRIGAMGGRASHNRDRDYDENYENRRSSNRNNTGREVSSNRGGSNNRSGYSGSNTGRGNNSSGRSSGNHSGYSTGRSFSSNRSNTNSRGSDSSRRGFGSMPRNEVRRIASMGGQASHGGRRGTNTRSRSRNNHDD